MSTALQSQRGAGTLMATVFLLLIVAMLGGIGLRLASTDINDTALQNDGVEALFLAESGLERALQKLAAGSVCGAAVIDATAQTLGRGTFQITSAFLNAGLCRVRVLGSVGLAGTTPATRLIEADLSLGGCLGWAVGAVSGGNEVLLCWNGSSWTRSGPYAAIPNTTLNSVTCATATDCWAVGNQSGGELIARWNGTTWTRITPTGPIPNQDLYSVHCFDANNCWAVGNNRTFLRWNGTAWSNGAVVAGFPNVRMNSVFCVAALDCWAVGNANTTGAPATRGEIIARWTGGSWTRVGPNAAIPDVNLLAVTCTSAADCKAVGAQSGGEIFLHFNGAWSRNGPYASIPNTTLNAIDCISPTDCWAVGNQSGGELITRWSAGAWSRNAISAAIPNQTLRGLFMVNTNESFAVGDSGLIIRRNGGAWSSQVSPVATALFAVTMAPAGGGAVAVQRWREIIQ